ncbi:Cyclin-U4-1 [Hibiscus syriacus]|uniref:Cyclin n=1 Tax=Hibiscus syriacus TaxID=106335 RepID=A0A6A2XYY8_HIBSY|nr:cyclin-U4-1-like [Hibiscus syriacus]KAE8661947.1 Cyclin-U4-1 [Hibiscus syriacus]
MAEPETELGLETFPRVIGFLSSLLQRVVESNDDRRLFQSSEKVSVFHGLTRPTISIRRYLERIFKYANCSSSCFLVAYVYLDRSVQMKRSLPINFYNVHRLLITSVLVSAKFMDDMYYNNAYYAKVGGISTAEMNILELDFLFGLGFQLNVEPTTFHTYCTLLQREMWMQIQPPLQHLPQPSSTIGRSLRIHCCLNEDESTHHHRLAV